VLVARSLRHQLREVVVGVDGSEAAARAAAFARRMPLPAEAGFTVAHVVRTSELHDGHIARETGFFEQLDEVGRRRRDAAERLVNGLVAELEAEGRRASVAIREGDPTACLVELIGERDADLIVAGARGESLIRALVVGSVADRLLKAAPCSVLLVH
jgi:nucleotide-binding universal stress UspA family protein